MRSAYFVGFEKWLKVVKSGFKLKVLMWWGFSG